MLGSRVTACVLAGFLLEASPVLAQKVPSADQLKREAFGIIDANAEKMGRVGDAIFSYSEIGFQEYKTVALLTKTLEDAGFQVQKGLAGMPTAYVATYGSGAPVIGLMADYDCIPDASQKPATLVHDPIVKGAPGHGEGHNTNPPTIIGAALAVKQLKDKYHLPGTIKVFGGPAEELVASRGYMVNAGVFNGVDVMLDAHVGTGLGTSYGLNNLAIISVQWHFTGIQAHGATAWTGRSALDAVEILDVMLNFMREHMEPQARIHYVIVEGGKQPNVVPASATVWYYFRHTDAQKLESLFKRAERAAQGAALATDTKVTERILSGSWPFNGNKALAELVDKNIQLVGMPKWSPDDETFARRFQKSMGAPITGLKTQVDPLRDSRQGSSSSDVGDVTWQVPYVRIFMPSNVEGALGGHHWSAAIGPATPVAHKGIAAGSRVLAASMIDLMVDPKALPVIKADFAKQLAAYPPWKSLIPAGATPPTFLNVEEMAKYRSALEKFEYDPSSSQTYLEFLGIPYPPPEPEAGAGKRSNQPGEQQNESR
jgi:aminobenzoyl-glutamate utilization protein B